MKKYISLCMLGIAAMLASCNQNEELTTIGNENLRIVSFSLQASEMLTRTTAAADRYVMEVYNSDGTPANVFNDGTTNHLSQSSADFRIKLDATKIYTCLFWADKEATEIYDVTSLKAVTLKAGKNAIEDSYYKSITVSGNTPAYSVTLNRAAAKILLQEHDHINAGSTLTVTFTPNLTFDVSNGTTTKGSETSLTFNITEAIDNPYKAIPSTYVAVTSFILLAPAVKELHTFGFSLVEGLNTTTKSVSNVPVRNTCQISVGGEFSGYTSKTLTASADDAWTEGEKETILLEVGADYIHTALDGTKYTCKVISSTSLKAVVVCLQLQPSSERVPAEAKIDAKGARFTTKAEFEKLVTDNIISVDIYSRIFCQEDCVGYYVNSEFGYYTTSGRPDIAAKYYLVFDIRA